MEESCKNDVKGKQITLTGTRNVETDTITTDRNAKKDKDAAEGNGLKGEVGIVNPQLQFFSQINKVLQVITITFRVKLALR